MNPLSVYHLLPPAGQNVAASLRGFYLNSWRYGAETEELVHQILERDYWSSEKWKNFLEERRAFILYRAATEVPFYKNYWEERRRKGDPASWEVLENWPILEKDSVRENSEAFLAQGCHKYQMFEEHTSGTTGKPLRLWWSRKTVRMWYALFEARWRRWHGVSRCERWGILGGQMVAPFKAARPPFWVWNAPMRQLYMSSYHLSPVFIPHYLEALKKYKVRYLYGYTAALHALAYEILRLKRSDLKMEVVLTNAEPLGERERRIIAEAFQCPVRETYGMTEIVAAAGECPAGRMHLWPEVGWIEVMNGNQKAQPGESGELVCTSLLNEDMPLIRYRLGDRGSLSQGASDEVCGCGRTLPLMGSIEGRSDDLLYTKDGRKIGRLDPVFKNGFPIREAQIIQETIDRLRIRYVPADESRGYEEAIASELRKRMGDVGVSFERVESIARTSNGKFRAVVSKISKPVTQ